MTRLPMPDRLREFAQNPPADIAEPKDAATIVVVRDGESGVEAYLMRRQSSMAFAAGFYVFPGGGVHDTDWPQANDSGVASIPWIGPDPEVWAQRWRTEPDRAHALVVAAVRETFEETGILLAGSDAESVVSDTTDLEWARDALEARELEFGQFLRDNGWSLRADLVGAWAHWITPAFEPRRYDTRFFVAALPAGQSVGAMSGEADRAAWAPLADVLAAVERGDAAMMPPTIATCREVSQHRASDIVAVASDRTFPTIEPYLVDVDGEMFLETYLGEPDEGESA